jgi:hypothetical protein
MTTNYPRNTGPMLSSPRCGAKTRLSKPCKSPAVRGKRRCRMHGGAPGSGAPRGNQNARSSIASSRAKPLRNVDACRTWCVSRACC